MIKEFGEHIPLSKGRSISAGQLLEKFLFSRKRQYDFVEKLSGGERKRLFLCTVLIQNPNFLILDEPTNDLDIATLTVLEDFLLDYPGCLLVVSHDRYFMDKIVDHLFVFRGEGVIEDFPGNYSDFRTYDDSKPLENNPEASPKEDIEKIKELPKISYQEKKEFESIEKDIAKLELKKTELENLFVEQKVPAEDIHYLSMELQDLNNLLAKYEERWLELSLKMD